MTIMSDLKEYVLIDRLIFVLTLPYSQSLQVWQAAEMNPLHRVAGLIFCYRLQSSAVHKALRVKSLLLHNEESHVMWCLSWDCCKDVLHPPGEDTKWRHYVTDVIVFVAGKYVVAER